MQGECCVENFFFNDTATTEIYTLSLHDALLISELNSLSDAEEKTGWKLLFDGKSLEHFRGYKKEDRKSTRLNSSHW